MRNKVNIQRYFDMKSKANFPVVEVTEEEFVAALVAAGQTEKEAKFQAGISKGVGASVVIGERKLKIK